MVKTNDPLEVVIGPVRFSYLTVFKPKKNDLNDTVEYSVTMLIPKEPHEHLADPKAEIKGIADTIKLALANKFGDKIPAKWKNPLRDGDTETNDAGDPKYPGNYFITSKCKQEYPPLLIDGMKRKVESGWNSGDWGKVKLKFFGFDQPANKGVSSGLRAVQFLFKDESFGGGEATDDGFDVVTTAATSGSKGTDWDPFADE